jgi:hypothetical protein
VFDKRINGLAGENQAVIHCLPLRMNRDDSAVGVPGVRRIRVRWVNVWQLGEGKR